MENKVFWANILTSPMSMANILKLFDFIPNVFFHVKDIHRKFLWMNLSLRQFLGETDELGFLGKTDSDYFSSDLVFLYHREDDEVIATCRPILNRPWFVPGQNGKQKWFISSKVPLTNSTGSVFAVAGLMWNLSYEYEASNPLNEMKTVIDYVFAHNTEKISVETLASLVFLSPRQFERRFYKLFHSTPSDFILKIRLDTAIRHLIESEDSVTQIALHCGFYDNSHFTRLFKKVMDISPLQFRKKYASKPPSAGLNKMNDFQE